MATRALKAACQCGSVNHELVVPAAYLPLKLQFCHCNSCRHTLGTHLTVAVLPEFYNPSPDFLAQSQAYEFSKRITAYFCATCGTHMFFHMKQSDGWPHNEKSYWAIQTGTLSQANAEVLDPDVHWFVGDTLDSGFADFLPSTGAEDKLIPRYSGWKEGSEFLSLYWRSPGLAQTLSSRSDNLHCYCQCGGVEFWIARPSERSKKVLDHSAWPLRDDGKKFLAGLCCCNSCRLDTGMEWIGWAFVPVVDVCLDGEGKVPLYLPFGTLKSYQSSPGVRRYHCGACGASVFYQSDDESDQIYVAVGLISAAEGARGGNWLEWSTKLFGREDGLSRAEHIIVALERGLQEFDKRI